MVMTTSDRCYVTPRFATRVIFTGLTQGGAIAKDC